MFHFTYLSSDDRHVAPHFPYSHLTLRVILPAILTVSFAASGLQIEGVVDRVVDGRTFILKDKRKAEHGIVLVGVETPVEGQPKYWDAMRVLGLLLRKKTVLVDWYRLESRCSRGPAKDCAKIAKVLRQPDGLDPALQMIQRGLAWHDPATIRDQSTTDRRLYQEAEQIAQFKRLGLWITLKPEPPWEFRKRKSTPNPKRKRK